MKSHFLHWTAARYYLAIASILLLSVAISPFISRTFIAPLQLNDYNHYACQVSNYTNDEGGAEPRQELSILTLSQAFAHEMADQLCSNPALGEHYQSVSVSWRPRDFLSLADIQISRFQLMFNREHMIRGIAPNYPIYYTRFHDSPTYALDWLSHQLLNSYTSDAFRGKNIGLLSDPHSQSFHIVPTDSLAEHGISLEAGQIQYFSDVTTLFKAFRDGDVDLISSPRNMFTELADNTYRLEISSNMSPGNWYLAHIVSPKIRCHLKQVLKQFDQEVFDHVSNESHCD